jgi:hypothetical protein
MTVIPELRGVKYPGPGVDVGPGFELSPGRDDGLVYAVAFAAGALPSP